MKLIKDKIKQLDPIDFSLQLTNFFILIHFSKQLKFDPLLFIPIIITSTIGILFQEARKSKLFWGIQIIFYFIWVTNYWQTIDNHRYLWGYWLLAIFISLITSNKKISLQISAKYLIACCMGWAVLHKALASTYLNGTFFHYKLITDSRFNFIGTFINEDLNQLIYNNRLLLNKLKLNAEVVVLNTGPDILHYIGLGLTWYVIIIELLLAILFFLPRVKFHYWQHWILLMFSTIYFLLPIKGFAFTLLTLGFVLLRQKDTQLKMTYCFFFLYIFAIASFFNEFAF